MAERYYFYVGILRRGRVHMPTQDSLRETLEHFRLQEKKLLEDLNAVRFTIKNIERAAGIESREIEASIPLEEKAGSDLAPPPSATVVNGLKPNIRADEFFGLTHADAARRYLKKVGHAVSTDELVDALQKGGCKLGGADPKRVLYISLVRNTRDFVPPQTGYIGLREFYPARASSAQDRKAKAPKRAGRRTQRQPKPKKTLGTRSAPTDKKLAEAQKEDPEKDAKKSNMPKDLVPAVREILGDGLFHTGNEIVQATRKKLGREVKPLLIYGVLRNKAFEKSDGKYRIAL